MEAVSAVKMRKSQQRALQGKPYAEAALRILHRISQSRDATQFITQPALETSAECIIVITSDKGLAGSLNSSVLKAVDLYLESKSRADTHIIAFGKKAYEHFVRRSYTVDTHYLNVNDNVSLEDMDDVTVCIREGFAKGTYGKVFIAFQSFVSTFEQNAVFRQVLPLDPLVLEEMVHDIVPKKGEFSDTMRNTEGHSYTVEPSPEEVAEVLVPSLVKIMLYHALLENKASEHSARMVAMKNATDKSKEMVHALTLLYNKERQAAITAEVSEITGGIEALKTST
jgi:F-type H+-transporting ATPase subunit gamma